MIEAGAGAVTEAAAEELSGLFEVAQAGGGDRLRL